MTLTRTSLIFIVLLAAATFSLVGAWWGSVSDPALFRQQDAFFYTLGAVIAAITMLILEHSIPNPPSKKILRGPIGLVAAGFVLGNLVALGVSLTLQVSAETMDWIFSKAIFGAFSGMFAASVVLLYLYKR